MSATEITELFSKQEDSGTRIVLYLEHAATCGFLEAIVRTPDSDVFFILLHHAPDIPMTVYSDIGVGENHRLINVSEMAKTKGREYCTAVLGLYVFTGEDATSAFKGMGKVAPLKKLEKNPKFQSVFRCSNACVLKFSEHYLLINSFRYRGAYFNPPIFWVNVLMGHFSNHLQKVFCLNAQPHRKHPVSLGMFY